MRNETTDFALDRTADARFTTTHWSEVLRAGNAQSQQSRQALENLCRAYWRPLYSYIRRNGRGPEEAEDLTQSFFAHLLERNGFATADRERGRFRSFLLAALKHFLINDWRHQHTQKRGGQFTIVSLDEQTPEGAYLAEPGHAVSPDVLFNKHWALSVLERVMNRLRNDYTSTEKGALFEEIKAFVAEKQGASHAEIASKYGISVSAVGVAIHRLRRRYVALLREEIAQTVADPGEVDDEIRYLIGILGAER